MAEEKNKQEEEMNRLFYLQNLYQQQYESVLNGLTTFGIAQASLERNLELLEKKEKIRGSNILVSTEGGSYIEASVKDVNRVVTYVGAGYLVEKTVQEAKDFMNKSLEASRDQIRRMANDKQKLETEMMRIQYAIEGMQQTH